MRITYNEAIDILARAGFSLISEKNGVKYYEHADGRSFALRPAEVLDDYDAERLTKVQWGTMIDARKYLIKTSSNRSGARSLLIVTVTVAVLIALLMFVSRLLGGAPR